MIFYVAETLKCWEGVVSCDKVVQKKHYSRPILMQVLAFDLKCILFFYIN